MFVELIEYLRCPRGHDESALVVSATRTESRHILDGTLGCPVCGAEFPIVHGVARFGAPAQPTPPTPPSAEAAMRLAAFLELTDARDFAFLCGHWAAHADHIRRISETPLVLVNPPGDVVADVAAVIETRDVLPFAPASARAVALTEESTPALIQSALTALRAKGRVLGPSGVALPAGLLELVRDERVWVAEKQAAPERAPRLVTLRRSGE